MVSFRRSIPFWASAIALSHPLKFSLDKLFCLLIILAMASSEYKRAYDAAKDELAGLLETQIRLEKRKIELRKTIEVLASLCESEGVEIEPSVDAADILETSTLADEIRAILRTNMFGEYRPNEIKAELAKLGCDLSKYGNPQATIHMVLKRMVESKHVKESQDSQGKYVYQWKPTAQDLARATKALADQSEYKRVREREKKI